MFTERGSQAHPGEGTMRGKRSRWNTAVGVFSHCISKAVQRETNVHARRMVLFGEDVDKIFCPALRGLCILGFGALKDACDI